MPELNDKFRSIRDGYGCKGDCPFSMHSDKRFVLGMLKAGASGYLLKECAFQELITAVNSVLSGGVYISPQIASHLVSDYVHISEDKIRSGIEILSGRGKRSAPADSRRKIH